MTHLTFFYLLLFAHVIGDFTFQSSKIVKSKSNFGRGFLYHILIVSFSYIIITLPYASLKWLYALIIISTTHTIVDYLKIKLNKTRKLSLTQDTIALLTDQTLHFLFMLFAYYIFKPWNLNAMGVNLLHAIFSNEQIANLYPDKIIFIFASILFLTRGGTVFVKTFSGRYKNGTDLKNGKNICSGVIIGEIERITLFIFFILQMYIFVALVILVKFIAQYYMKPKEERDFKGTTYSFALALILGIIYNALFLW